MSERKGFNFYRSYFDVMEELTEKDQLKFIKALLNRQFLGIEPNLDGMAKFAYLSQKHSIDRQVKGFEDKTGCRLTPTEPPTVGSTEPPLVQEKVQVQEKEKVQQFELFWSKYPKKVSKGKCQSKFTKLPQKDIDNILNNLDRYIAYKPFAEYNHPNPMTFLNQRRWEDELPKIIDNTKPNPNQMISSPEDVKNLFES